MVKIGKSGNMVQHKGECLFSINSILPLPYMLRKTCFGVQVEFEFHSKSAMNSKSDFSNRQHRFIVSCHKLQLEHDGNSNVRRNYPFWVES